MVILDTDHLTLLFEGGVAGLHIRQRLDGLPVGKVGITIVSYQEQIRGRLAVISGAKSVAQLVDGYQKLHLHIRYFEKMPIIDFTPAAAVEFQRLRKIGLRIGTMDLRIAAIAVIEGATIVTRNIRDFGQVPGLMTAD